MRKTLLYVVISLFIALPSLAEYPGKAGKWRITVDMDIPGMPMKLKPVSFEHCVTEEDLKNPEKVVPSDPNNPCKVSDLKVDGNTVSWTVDCPKSKAKGTGEITYDGDSYAGAMKMQVEDRTMTANYTGKLLGACDN